MSSGKVQLPLEKGQKITLPAQDGLGKFEALITAVRPPAPLLRQPFWEFDWIKGNLKGTGEVSAAANKVKVTSREHVEEIPF